MGAIGSSSSGISMVLKNGAWLPATGNNMVMYIQSSSICLSASWIMYWSFWQRNNLLCTSIGISQQFKSDLICLNIIFILHHCIWEDFRTCLVLSRYRRLGTFQRCEDCSRAKQLIMCYNTRHSSLFPWWSSLLVTVIMLSLFTVLTYLSSFHRKIYSALTIIFIILYIS